MMKPTALQLVSERIHSSKHYGDVDDSLKDEDNVAWVAELQNPIELDDWVTILQWIRIPDRLLERDTFQDPHPKARYTFKSFIADWVELRKGRINNNSPFASLFQRLSERWKRDKLTEKDLKIWDLYLHSLEKFVRPDLAIPDMREYRKALYGLSGTIYQTLPYAPVGCFREIGILGTLDQFFNNMRDLGEDTVRGICYYPQSLLEEFQIEAQELPGQMTLPDRRFIRLNEFLLSSFASPLVARLSPLLTADSLHHSWVTALHNTMVRHKRIEYAFRASRFSVKTFRNVYWDCVRRDLQRTKRKHGAAEVLQNQPSHEPVASWAEFH